MTRIYSVPFAAGGDREAIETDAQPDGKMSNEQGWTPDYEKLQSDPDYRPVGRKEMNGVLYELSKAVGDLQLQGFPSWEAIEWPEGAIVVRDGVVYRALTDTEEEPPSGDWERYAYVVEATEADAGTVRLATQAEAEAGSGDGVTTATRVGQAIDALRSIYVVSNRSYRDVLHGYNLDGRVREWSDGRVEIWIRLIEGDWHDGADVLTPYDKLKKQGVNLQISGPNSTLGIAFVDDSQHPRIELTRQSGVVDEAYVYISGFLDT